METIKRITSFTHITTAEGDRISATYSEISEDGTLIKSNNKLNVIVLDEEVEEAINTIKRFIESKI